jgi:transcriptional regulator with GAF, ATPase, and Fis domain
VTNHDVPTDLLDERDGEAPRLVATWNGGTVTRALPASGTLTLGRGDTVDVFIDDTSVSRNHARIAVGERIVVEDLGSSNGTWVDGERLAPHANAEVRPGTLIELGNVLIVIRAPGYARAKARDASDGTGLVIRDPAMDRVVELVELAARSKLSVVLLGETGVGKEVIAGLLHSGSPRAAQPFLKINCATLVESLLEAELFGYERGAFTGAFQSKAGLIESADGGTFFLDEVGEIPLATQAKLLRVLESGQVTRIGGLRPRAVDVRYVAATNRDLSRMVKTGKFRQDLFFRIDGLSIHIPPLRQRTSEIGPLAEMFIGQACAEAERPVIALSDEALRKLLSHPWPGNVRELRNVIARSVLLCRSRTIGPEDIHFESPAMSSPSAGGRSERAAPRTVEATAESERERIVAALAEAGGNQTRAAKLLGISRRTLIYRLDMLGLPRPRKDEG